ncbi:uncharacterized protein LOC143053546 [Mytilus galloprovincialis]|uniref:uncharacterized protein LOC143053546 n=1 Tax=Mytilus galloprovincialis TaxID=29158 RepID=UPI003F7CAAA0
MMNIFATTLFLYLTIVSRADFNFHLKCMHTSQWKHRAAAICQRNDVYHCLYDVNKKRWGEECFLPVDLPPGYHSVLSGQLHVKQCKDNYFSPYISWSNEGYECQYQKHLCNEEGQIVVDTGSNVRDIKCKCDYRKGYVFVIKPKDECTCSPSVEDCSCHQTHCQNNSFTLSQDYVCLSKDHTARVMSCSTIENLRNERLGHEFTWESSDDEERKEESIVFSFSDPHQMKFPFLCIGVFVIACLMYLIGVCFIFKQWFTSTERGHEFDQSILKNVEKLSSFSVLKDTLNGASVLVLTGREGTGKNTLAKCLQMLYPEKRCNIIHIRKTNLKYNLPKEDHIIVDSHENVLAFDKSIKTYLHDIKGTKLIIVVEDFPPNLTTILKKCGNYQTQTIFDLDNHEFYNTIDKENILKLHMKMNKIYSEDEMTRLQSKETPENVYISNSLFTDLLNEKTLLGFPLMCASLCSHKDHIQQGIRYFMQPPVQLITQIKDLRKKGESDDLSAIQYCLFVAVLLCLNNKMSLIDGDLQASITKSMTHIFPYRSLSFGLNLLQTIAFHSMPYYFESSKSELTFSHHTIYQAVLITYCNTHPHPMLEKCNLGDIIFFLRPLNYQPLKDEMVLTVDYRQSDFVTLVINSLMFESLNTDNIIKQIKRLIEYYNDTQLLQLIINHVKSDETYTHQFRLRCFREFGEYVRIYKNIFNVELEAYCLAWKYVCIKKEENEDDLNTFKGNIFACASGVIGNVLNTLVDKFGNTLLHYFVIWNGKVENNIINTILKNKDEHGIVDVWKTTNLENVRRHTPLHFAVYFGRQDFIDKFITMKDMANSKETWLHSLYGNFRKWFMNEKENLMLLLESGINHISEDIKIDKDSNILFEYELIPSQSAIKFGKTEEFDHIMSILQNKI